MTTVTPDVQFRADRSSRELIQPIDARGRFYSRCGSLFGHLLVWGFLLAIAWAAHFSQSRNIGFYSDDQTFAARPLTWSSSDFLFWLRYKTVSYPEPQGRPLGFMLGILFAYLGDRLAGVNGMFIVGWWILSLNAILFYHLLRRCFSSPIPLLGAICFLLFPADTTRPFLCHQHILQPSLTFMLIAAHLYLGGGKARRVLAYFLVTLCLITYESALLPFIAIPLLETSRDTAWKKRFVRHVLTVLAIIAFIGLTRKLGHEYRTEEASTGKTSVLLEIAAGSFIGPAAAAGSFVLRGGTAIVHLWKEPAAVAGFAAAVAMFWLVLRGLGSRGEDQPEARSGVRSDQDLHRAMQFGIVALGVSYVLSFTHFPPACLEGQTTSVHLAAVIGASVLFAAAAGWLLRCSGIKWLGAAAVATYLALLLTSAVAEQDGYVALWQERQQFWTRLIDLCPDLQDHTLVICDGQLPQPNHLMPANCWSDSVVLEQVYQMPERFRQNPQVSCFPRGELADWLQRDASGRVVWSKSPYGRKIGDELVPGNTILLRMDDDGRITRVGGSSMIGGKPFKLRDPVARGKLPFPTLRFYGILSDADR
jgi:hypothetical protein